MKRVLFAAAILISGAARAHEVIHAEHAALHTAEKDAHPRFRHGDHFDYLHDGRLHFVHGDHVDDHGPIAVVRDGA